MKLSEATRVKKREQARRWRAANRDRVRARDKAWYAANPDKARMYRLTNKYGLTVGEYTAMYDAQDGKCKLCRILIARWGRHTHVDHVHKSKPVIVRGLLCGHCNVALGHLEVRGAVEGFARNIVNYVRTNGERS